MDWLNIHIAKQIRSPAAIGSAPSELGTWVRVLAYCCEQENGGRIAGGASWKDRQWQQTCAVTIRELRSADRLIRFDGSDVVVNGYPVEKEAEVQRARRRASAGAMARWGHRESISPSNAQACARADAEGEREVGRGSGKAEACAAASAAAAMDDAMEGMQPAPSTPHRLNFADWRIGVGHRCFIGRDERAEWEALFAAEGWESMSQGYAILDRKHPKPAKLFLSMFQEIRK